jgi:transcriptional regulator GlxA family with amidase domain
MFMKRIAIAAVLLLAALMVLGAATTAHPAAAAKEQWVCPMPEDKEVHDQPGNCPVCGMDLIRKEVLDLNLLAAKGRGPGADLAAPRSGKIRVAFVLSEDATMIDFAGPWEVFSDVHVVGRGSSMDEVMPFELYTVSDRRDPIHVSGGMTVVPDYTFADAPVPRVVIVPAQTSRTPQLLSWLQAQRRTADVVASVCTGAFILGRAGLLDGKEATTHHEFYGAFLKENPRVKVVRGRRFVQTDSVVATAGGLSSGIDLALHVVERYFGTDVAHQTAQYMEYDSNAWRTGVATASR